MTESRAADPKCKVRRTQTKMMMVEAELTTEVK